MTVKDINLQTDKAKSARAFQKFAAPILQKLFSAKLIDVENDSSKLAELLDRACGVDYLLRTREGVMGIAARVTHNWQRNYHTFTLRKEKYEKPSEFQHLQNALAVGGIIPTLFVQCYPKGNSATVCICQTKELLKQIAAGKAQVKNKCGVDFFSIDVEKVSGSKKISVTLPPQIKKFR